MFKPNAHGQKTRTIFIYKVPGDPSPYRDPAAGLSGDAVYLTTHVKITAATVGADER